MSIELPWEVIDKYFKDNKNVLISHQLNSFNDFFDNGINRIFREKNPIKILKQQNLETKNFNRKNIDEIISEKIIDLPILSNDTNTVIIFNDSFSNKKDNGKKRSFWDLLRSK